ncbi:putative cytochrome P450 [Helianthus debilis subsp. tardiflorus]
MEFLGYMLGDFVQVILICVDLFAAGTDVTSTSMEWAISELIRHPRVMKTLQKEVTEIAHGKPMITEDDLEKMTYLHAVLKEALRLLDGYSY